MEVILMKGYIRGRFKTGPLLILLCALIFFGCASPRGNVHFKSIPSDVEVVDLESNTLLGMTPIDSSWGGKRNKPKLITVRFQKIGYKDRIETFSDKGNEITVEVEMERED
jgi:hypothetical protein